MTKSKISRNPSKPGPLENGKQKHLWEFPRYFRAGAYGWRGTALASKRIAAAVREIRSVAQKDSAGAARGIVVFFEKCWRAIEHINSSSGAIGTAVGRAIVDLTEIFAEAHISDAERNSLIERIWDAFQEEDYGYYDELGELWPKMCGNREMASQWADYFLPTVKLVSADTAPGAFFKGTIPCLASLITAGRYDEVLDIVRIEKPGFFHYQQFGIRALAAKGNLEKALELVESFADDPSYAGHAAALGEEILLSVGREQEAYEKYGLRSAIRSTGLATFSAIVKKYPSLPPERIVRDLMAFEPGNEGRYFAAARKAGLIDLAVTIAQTAGVEPKTLTTACKDSLKKNPGLALRFGMIALERLAEGFGYDITSLDVLRAYHAALDAARASGREGEILARIAKIAEHDRSIGRLVSSVIGRRPDFVFGQREGKRLPLEQPDKEHL